MNEIGMIEKTLYLLSGALISALVNAIFNYRIKVKEFEIRDIEIALKLTEIREKQVVTLAEIAHRKGRDKGVRLIDPALQMASYLKALKEIKSKGAWELGEWRSKNPDKFVAGDETPSDFEPGGTEQ